MIIINHEVSSFQTDTTENPHKNGDIKPAENGVTTGNVSDKKTD